MRVAERAEALGRPVGRVVAPRAWRSGSDFTTPVLIAAGGGGGAGSEDSGGGAGLLSGGAGAPGNPCSGMSGCGGGGGNNTTMMVGGAGPADPGCTGCAAGVNGSASSSAGPGGGGGGGVGQLPGGGGGGAGYFGGGGGGGANTSAGGGGGGSDFCASSLTGASLSGCGATGTNGMFGTASVVLTYTVSDTDLSIGTAPNVTTDATSPDGAAVTYTAPIASDPDDSTVPAVSCMPSSGSTFAIGTTTVTCTATDSDDTPSTVQSTFTVTVKGALAQLRDLLTYVNTLGFRGKLLAAEVDNAISNYQHGHTGRVCANLSGVVFTARVERSGHLITAAQANTVIGDAARIQAVIGREQH